MSSTAFFSGQFHRWTAGKQVGVSKYCGRVRFDGLYYALSGPHTDIVIMVNGERISDWHHEGDYLHFKKPYGPGNLRITIEIIYNYLSQAVYS